MNELTSTGSLTDNPRVAKVGEKDGNPVGVCIHLTSTDLRQLDIDPNDADEVTYSIDTTTKQLTVQGTRAGDSDD